MAENAELPLTEEARRFLHVVYEQSEQTTTELPTGHVYEALKTGFEGYWTACGELRARNYVTTEGVDWVRLTEAGLEAAHQLFPARHETAD